MTNFEELRLQSKEWIADLQEKLTKAGEESLNIPYNRVARAFPSAAPNPRSFECPLLDHDALREWVNKLGYSAQFVSNSDKADQYPLVQFTKIHTIKI